MFAACACAQEIALTQHLLDLFIQYQIPSDLLSFDGDAAANATAKVDAVRRHVSAIVSMIGDAKKEALAARFPLKP